MKFFLLKKLSLFLRRYARRFRAYCIGMGKTGTTSIAELFRCNYRSMHEPEARRVLHVIFKNCAKEDLIRFVRAQDNRLRLEMNSSTLNYWFLDILLEEFKDAKFILTIRDCYSWLDSVINHQLTWHVPRDWVRYRELCYRPDKFKHTKQDQILAEYGLYSIDGYLSYWAKHNSDVISKVPKDRLLMIRTDRIGREIDRIASFLNIPSESLDISKAHSFKAKKKFGLLAKIDKSFEERVNIYCRDLMDKYFSGVTYDTVIHS